jgi:hypothetical protein
VIQHKNIDICYNRAKEELSRTGRYLRICYFSTVESKLLKNNISDLDLTTYTNTGFCYDLRALFGLADCYYTHNRGYSVSSTLKVTHRQNFKAPSNRKSYSVSAHPVKILPYVRQIWEEVRYFYGSTISDP